MKLTKELLILLEILGTVARGEKTEYTEEIFEDNGIDVSKMGNLAVMQEVDCIYKYGIGCKQEIMPIVMKQIQGREKLLQLLKDINEAGISVLVMKGVALAESYCEPYLRLSNDTDLFVNECDEKRLNDFLSAKGFLVGKRPRTSQHGHASHPQYGMFETHVKFFQDKITDYWKNVTGMDIFRVPNSAPITINGKQGEIKTLDYTEHFLFICLHMMKHFLSMENSIKIVLDVNAFGYRFADFIDWEYIWNIMAKLTYDITLMATFAVGEKYMHFPHFCQKELNVSEDVVNEYIAIVSDYTGNESISDEFHDAFWAGKMGEQNGIAAKISMVIKTLPYLPEYIKRESFSSAIKKGVKKTIRIMRPSGGLSNLENGRKEEGKMEEIERRNAHFKSLGLM